MLEAGGCVAGSRPPWRVSVMPGARVTCALPQTQHEARAKATRKRQPRSHTRAAAHDSIGAAAGAAPAAGADVSAAGAAPSSPFLPFVPRCLK